MSEQQQSRTGRCLCGAVALTVRTGSGVSICHCGLCRRWSGGPMFALHCEEAPCIDGLDQVTVFATSEWAERGFCRRCGTHLFYRLRDGGFHAVPAGLFGDADDLVLEEQVFIDRQPGYYAFANQTRTLTEAQVFTLFGASTDD